MRVCLFLKRWLGVPVVVFTSRQTIQFMFLYRLGELKPMRKRVIESSLSIPLCLFLLHPLRSSPLFLRTLSILTDACDKQPLYFHFAAE